MASDHHQNGGHSTRAQQQYQYSAQLGGGGPLFERNQEATVYVGNLDLKINEDLVWELFLQCGPIVNVHIPRDKVTNEHQSYGFVEFKSEEDADYAIKILHMVKLCGKPIKVNKATQDKRTQEVGANIFVGNIHEDVDEKMLRDVFSSFGIVLSTKIMRDPENGVSKRYGFVSYDNFDSSDASIQAMNGQYLCGKPVDVSYAYKKDTQTGEKHGSMAERVLAYNKPNSNTILANATTTTNAKPLAPPVAMPPPPTSIPPPSSLPQNSYIHQAPQMNYYPQPTTMPPPPQGQFGMPQQYYGMPQQQYGYQMPPPPTMPPPPNYR